MKHPVDIYVGKRLRHARWMQGLSQEELAQASGVTFQQIQKYETGANRVSASRLWELAGVVGVPIGFFYDGFKVRDLETCLEDVQATAIPVECAESMREAAILTRAYYGMPEASRRHFLDLVKSLVKSA